MDRLRFLLSLVREHWLSYVAGFVLLGLTLWMSLSIPRYLQQAVDLLSQSPQPDTAGFFNRIAWVLVFALLVMGTRTGSRLFFFFPGRRVEYDLKNRLLTHLASLQRNFFMEHPSGAIISRINNDINGVRMMMGFGIMQMFNAVGTLTLAPYFMYQISPWLTLYCAIPIVIAFILLQIGLRRLRHEQLKQMEALQRLSDFTVESYNGLNVLSAYRAHRWAEDTFNGHSREVRNSAIRMSNIRAYLLPILTHIVNGLKVVLMLVGGMMVVRGEMSVGGLLSYGLYLTMLVPPLMGMTFMMFMVQRGITALISLETIFRMQPELPPLVADAEQAAQAPMQEGLAVRELTYAYPDDPAHPKLGGVSLEIHPGEIVGLFGAIGSGKTTLVNLLNRYLTPPPGAVLWDGMDVRDISLATLRRHIVTVTQEPFLFSDSVRDNISFGAVEGEAPQAVDTAAEAASLAEDVSRFPAGLDTMVGEKGITLSGGQKQRISLARSMLKPCDLLILDDVLSAVDHETERYLIDQIYRFQHARALLIVSHRVSVLERAQRIVVLAEGRVQATGTHAELIREPGPYRDAWLLQHEAPPAIPGDPADAATPSSPN